MGGGLGSLPVSIRTNSIGYLERIDIDGRGGEVEDTKNLFPCRADSIWQRSEKLTSG
jgi:hypothetical protein